MAAGPNEEEIRREDAELVKPGVWASPLTVDVTVSDGVARLRGQVQRRSFAAVLARMTEAVDDVVWVECALGWEVDDTGLTPVTPCGWASERPRTASPLTGGGARPRR